MTARSQENEENPARLSFITAVVSGMLVLALIGYLTWHALYPGEQAAIAAEVVAAEAWQSDGRMYVPIEVRNVGSQPASQVVIEMHLNDDVGGETTIDFLAGGENQRIYVAVPMDTDVPALAARVVSFQEP